MVSPAACVWIASSPPPTLVCRHCPTIQRLNLGRSLPIHQPRDRRRDAGDQSARIHAIRLAGSARQVQHALGPRLAIDHTRWAGLISIRSRF